MKANFNKYKNTFNDLINSSNTEFPYYLNWLGLMNKRSHNIVKFKVNLPIFFKEDCLNKNVFVMSLELKLKIRNF